MFSSSDSTRDLFRGAFRGLRAWRLGRFGALVPGHAGPRGRGLLSGLGRTDGHTDRRTGCGVRRAAGSAGCSGGGGDPPLSTSIRPARQGSERQHCSVRSLGSASARLGSALTRLGQAIAREVLEARDRRRNRHHLLASLRRYAGPVRQGCPCCLARRPRGPGCVRGRGEGQVLAEAGVRTVRPFAPSRSRAQARWSRRTLADATARDPGASAAVGPLAPWPTQRTFHQGTTSSSPWYHFYRTDPL